MKNFTAAMFSFCESVVSNSRQSMTVKNSEVESIHNNSINLFKNIFTKTFLWGFYGVFSSLFKSPGRQITSIRKGFNNSVKYHGYLNFVTGSKVYVNADEASITSRGLIGVLVVDPITEKNLLNIRVREMLLFLMVSFVSFCSLSQNTTCPVILHNPYTDFNASPSPQVPTTMWVNVHTKLSSSDLAINGDFLLFTGGSVSFGGTPPAYATPAVLTAPIPDGKIIADNTVTVPITNFDSPTNTWITRVPLGYSSSDIFITAGAITSATGFTTAYKPSAIKGQFYSNITPALTSAWFYGLAAYRPTFTYSDVGAPGNVTSVGGGIKAGTPQNQIAGLVQGGSGGGGSNYTGSYSSTDNFTACVGSPCVIPTATVTQPTCTLPTGTIVVTAPAPAANVTYTLTGTNPVVAGVTQATTTFAGLAPGVYNVVTTNTTTGCVSAPITLTVNPVPGAPAKLVVTGAGTICIGSSATLTASACDGTYLWNTGATTSAIIVTTAGTYTVTCTKNGCTSPASDNAIVTINPLPTATASYNNPVCLNSKLELNVETNGTSFSWTGPDTFTSSVQKPVISSAKAVNGGVYTVIVSNVNSCAATATVSVAVNALPTPTAKSLEVCVGKPITLEASDGFAKYEWSKIAGVGTFTASTQKPLVNLSAVTDNAGTYQVLVTNVNGCTAIATATVIVNELPKPTAKNNGPVCTGTPLVLTADGGTSYSWLDGKGSFAGTTAVVTIPNAVTGNAGIYTVTVTNSKGCVATATTEVKVNSNQNPEITAIPAVCLGTVYKLNVSGATGNTFAWSGSNSFTSTEQNPSVIPTPTTAGTYTYFVTVSGTGGCTGTATTSVIIRPNPILTVQSTSICAGTTGKLMASGATTYAWSSNTGETFTSTVAELSVTKQGIYTVIGTTYGCTAVATTTVEVKVLPTVTLTPIAICTGTTGTLTATGTNVATYAWSSNTGETFTSTTATISVTKAGTYTVIGTSAGGCTASATTTVTVNTKPYPEITPIPSVCSGGNVVLNVSGTTGNTYAWSGSGFTSTEQNPTVIPKPTTAGTYTYFVTVSGLGGCTGTATTSVTVKANPTVTVPSIAICAGGNGTLVASGATTYAWTGPGTFTTTSANLSVTQAGTYTVIGSINGCSATTTVAVTLNPTPTAEVTPPSSVCASSNVTLTATGGNTYLWTAPSGFTSTGATVTITNANATNTGTFSVLVSSDKGCTVLATTSVTLNDKPNPSITTKPSVCSGEPIVLNVSGGTGNKFTWSGSGFTSSVQNPTVIPTPIAAGIYTYAVLVEGTGGCTGTATTAVRVKAIPTVTVPTIAICVGTTDTLRASGADSYSWSKGATTFTTTTAKLAINETGTYTVIGTINGCSATTTVAVTPKGVADIKASSVEICTGQAKELKATGGVTYTWSGADSFTATGAIVTVPKDGTYTVIGKNADGCIGTATATLTTKDNPKVVVTGDTVICIGTKAKLTASGTGTFSWSQTPSGFTSTSATVEVGQGMYQVTVTNGLCSAIGTVKVRENANPKVVITGDTVICTGTKAKLTASGTGIFSWSQTPAGFTSTSATVEVGQGTYQVIVTSGLCSATGTVKVRENANPTVVISGNSVICADGKTTLKSSGTGIFAWTGTGSFTATTATVEVSAGTYQVTVTNGSCSAVGTIKVVNDNLSISAGGATVCEGALTTALTGGATATSGIKSYVWSGPSGFTSTEQSPTITKPTATATYTLTVSSKAGCTATATAIITVTPAVTNTANVTFCKGGKAILTATGGAGATYLWTGGATTSSIEVTTAGTYNVTITDLTGCISKGVFTVTESAAASAIISGNTSLCASTSTTLTVNAGVTGKTYSWTGVGGFTSNSQVITVSTPGNYAVLVKTQEGCEGTAKVTVTAGFTPTAVCGPVCVGDSIRFSATQLRGLTYSWSKEGRFISSSADPKLLNVQKSDEGVYQVVITGGGCTATVVATLVVYDKPTGITATGQSATCNQDTPKNDGSVKLVGTFTGLKYDIVEGATYTGTKKYVDATNIPANGIVKSSIANPATNAGTKYTVRVFNTNNCYEDYPVTIQQVTCLCGEAKCVPFSVVKTKVRRSK